MDQAAVLDGQTIVVLIDISYSSREQLQAWKNELEQLAANYPGVNWKYRFFTNLVSQPMATLEQLNNGQLLSVGQTNRMAALQEAGTYDEAAAIIMLTDASTSDADPGSGNFADSAEPIFMVHTGQLPIYSSALTEAVIHSDGEVTGSLTEAMSLVSLKLRTSNYFQETEVIDVSQQGLWVRPSERGSAPNAALLVPTAEALTDLQPFVLLAQKKSLEQDMDLASPADFTNLEFLDRLNQQATVRGIVTPHSSLIALVNDTQRRQLERAMQQAGRYRVNLNIGEENLADPSGSEILATSAVPEPHEWLLMAVGAGLLGYLFRDRVRELALSLHHDR
jgi:hypothetical protein